MKNEKPQEVVKAEDVVTLSRALGSWFVRLDNSFYDVDDLTHKRSRVDIEQTAIIRFKEEYPHIELTNALIAAVFKRAINSRHTETSEMILPWSGRQVCRPGVADRILVERGVATLNTWSEPEYRTLRVNSADWGPVGEFFDWFFQRQEEKEMFLNWLAWCLQNEGDKPNWAPFFYSRRMGTGKSAMSGLLVKLFGESNAITQNNVDKLTGRFNMPILRSKLVICEEVHLRPGSADANTLKTYITEKHASAEAKGKELERVEQRLCMVLTSNHMPFWIEPEDRRYYIVDVDHDGYAKGPRAAEFAALVGRMKDWLEEPANVARLYNQLMQRALPEGFTVKTMNVEEHGTAIMKQVFGNGRATVLDQLQEFLDGEEKNAIAEADVVHVVTRSLKANINSTKHLMSDLGWMKQSVKWGGVDHARQIWLRPGFTAQKGKIFGPDGYEEDLANHLPVKFDLF
ncbi:hypothetical protein CEW89_16475 [Celeribacter ethanolicus]|uniref:NrS-1 polymerase-like helicase domain-containing protein n=1 Tax=Celeribacter ethanolicus TaxID=1758178 RepID=A0A291GG86_9RHOB|nr:primase-helicase family protein [Celeribacter ethanolicus]ATG49024.1 hypothetical protein CEW89_16475 [Celeribacter ethanolicus]